MAMQVVESVAVVEAVGVPSDVIASSRHADPECGRPAEMAAVGLEKVDWYAQCHWSGQLWRLKDRLSAEEVQYLDEVR